ncbi:cytochrome b561 [Elusimicrobium posterum]|uniref:hypothetical protein n=1 Tax=Elusimicrobium posterum TaxID=3116653 RepID=UPI003C7301CD
MNTKKIFIYGITAFVWLMAFAGYCGLQYMLLRGGFSEDAGRMFQQIISSISVTIVLLFLTRLFMQFAREQANGENK